MAQDVDMEDRQDRSQAATALRSQARIGERARERLAAIAVVRRAFAAGAPGKAGARLGFGAVVAGKRGARGDGVDIDDHIRLAVREETAASLGVAGRRLGDCMAALLACGHEATRERIALRDQAVQALWEFVVQREAVGLTDHRLLEQHYGVTAELWRRMGAAPAHPIG